MPGSSTRPEGRLDHWSVVGDFKRFEEVRGKRRSSRLRLAIRTPRSASPFGRMAPTISFGLLVSIRGEWERDRGAQPIVQIPLPRGIRGEPNCK
jgi:hypothetical protein